MTGPARLHRRTRRILAAAGWHAGRAVDTARWEAELAADGFWGADLGRDLAPIGVLAGGTAAWANLGLDDRGELYFVLDSLATFGRPPQALDTLVLGHMPADVTEPAR